MNHKRDREDLEKLRTLARFPDENPNPVLRIAADNKVDYANEASRSLLTALGADVGESVDAVHRRHFDAARREGKPRQFELDTDGRTFTLDITPVRDAEYLYVYGKDVTRRREAEAQMRVMAKFPSENPNPVLRVHPSGRIEFANGPASALLEELQGGERESVPDEWMASFADAHQAREPRELEIDVADRVFSLALTPVADADYLYVYGKDISERKSAENELIAARDAAETANRTKSAFLANMSHELRTPLNAILGYAELLEEDAVDTGQDDFVPDLKKIRSAGKHLLGLINQVLDLSKIESGKMELYYETFSVATLLDEVVHATAPLLTKNGNTLDLGELESLGSIRSDITKLRQVLLNLVSNASKFTSHGTVSLKAAVDAQDDGDAFVRIDVADTGIGMTEEQLAKIFQPFTQADVSTTRQFGGTGLGLAISEAFCRMLGGEIRVQSQKDVGTTFTVRVPLGLDEAESAASDSADPIAIDVGTVASGRQSSTDTSDKPLILVIDDDPTVLELLSRTLNGDRFSVRVARNGKEGLTLAHSLQPAAITLDVMMPDIDGWRVLAELKSDPELAHIPVVMLTMVDERGAGFALGAADYLSKPIERDRLISVLTRHVSSGEGPIMVVDDEPDNREVMRRTLEREGLEVIEAENGRVALEKLEAKTPSLILLDLMMPELDGFEVVAQLQSRPDWKNIPVVVVTAKNLMEDDRERLEGFVASTLQKQTHSREELLDMVHSLVSSRVTPDEDKEVV